ncbi:MAG: type II secretion system protein [Desulfonatronovibrionaceae bacterium]
MKSSGFTLLETIVTIVVAAILATLLVVFFNKSVTRSSDPLRWSEQETSIKQKMEEVVAVFNEYDPYADSSNATHSLYNDSICDDNGVDCERGKFNPSTKEFETENCNLASDGECLLKVTVSDPDNPGHELTSIFADYN